MNADDFDDELEAMDALREDIVGPESDAQRFLADSATPAARRMNKTVRGLLERPEVARMFISGMPDNEIAAALGCAVSTIRRVRTQNPRMADLIAAEANRVIAHMSTRKLEDVKYLALATALGGMIEKQQLLQGEATHRTEFVGEGTVANLTIALFGVPRPRRIEHSAGASGDPGARRELADVSEAQDGELLQPATEGETD